ncbi:hypothetical protein GCM10027299_21930 [Larkinella ripae]
MNKVSGYTEIELNDGTRLPLKFGMWAFREMCKTWQVGFKVLPIEVATRFEEDEASTLFILLGKSAEYASRVNGNPKVFDEAIVSSWIDDLSPEKRIVALDQIMNAYNEALGIDLAAETTQIEGNVPAPQEG